MWKDYNKEKPEDGVEVIAYNKAWEDPDFNPRGFRVGFIGGEGDFISAYWWDYQDDYIAIYKDKVEEDDNSREFYKGHVGNTEPEYWMPIPDFKKPE